MSEGGFGFPFQSVFSRSHPLCKQVRVHSLFALKPTSLHSTAPLHSHSTSLGFARRSARAAAEILRLLLDRVLFAIRGGERCGKFVVVIIEKQSKNTVESGRLTSFLPIRRRCRCRSQRQTLKRGWKERQCLTGIEEAEKEKGTGR